jgi:hypothetical protein
MSELQTVFKTMSRMEQLYFRMIAFLQMPVACRRIATQPSIK